MIKINKVNIKGFKSLVNTEVELFGSTNMFYGFNNSGKSNIFKFLKILFQRKSNLSKVKYSTGENDGVQKTVKDVLTSTTNFWSGNILEEPFIFTNNDRTTPIEFSIFLEISDDLIYNQEILKTRGYLKPAGLTDVKLVGSITAIDSETSKLQIVEGKLNDKSFYRNDDEIDYFFEEEDEDSLSTASGEYILNLFNNLVLIIDSNRNFSSEIAKNGVTEFDILNFKNGLFELYINSEKNESFNKLISFLGKFDFSPEAKQKLGSNFKSFPFKDPTDLGFARFESELEIMLKNENGKFPLKNFGTGIQQFLFIIASIWFSKSRIVIIEEIELNLHPLFQRELLIFIKTLMPSLFDQFLFSSHSPFFTLKDSILIDVLHHVRIDFVKGGGTSVDCHGDPKDMFHDDINSSYMSELYS